MSTTHSRSTTPMVATTTTRVPPSVTAPDPVPSEAGSPAKDSTCDAVLSNIGKFVSATQSFYQNVHIYACVLLIVFLLVKVYTAYHTRRLANAMAANAGLKSGMCTPCRRSVSPDIVPSRPIPVPNGGVAYMRAPGK